MFSKRRRERDNLERSGSRAPATVIEIAETGYEVNRSSTDLLGLFWRSSEPGREIVRMTTLRVEPNGEPAFEVRKRMRYGRLGGRVPKAGDRIEVLYDPADHDKIVVAPPTTQEEQARTMAALSQAKVGFSTGSGGAMSPEFLAQHQEALAQAQRTAELMQQYAQDAAEASKQEDER